MEKPDIQDSTDFLGWSLYRIRRKIIQTAKRWVDFIFKWPNSIIVILVIMTVYSFYPHPIEFGGDAVGHWRRAIQLVNEGGKVSASHQSMRWAIGLVEYTLVSIFGDSANYYFLGPMIAMSVFLMVFSFLIHRLLGAGYVSLFLLLVLVEPELWRQSFQILPTSFGLLTFSLFALAYYFYLKRASKSLFSFLFLGLFLFYGAKFTNLFFLPGFALVLILWRKPKLLAAFVGGMAALYVAEAVVLNWLTIEKIPFGRIQGLLQTHNKFLNVAALTRFSVTDLFERWLKVKSISRFFYFLFFLLAAKMFLLRNHRHSEGEKQRSELLASEFMWTMALMGLSFALMTTFFVNSISPLVLGQSFRSRYLAILLPICFLILLWALREIGRVNDLGYRVIWMFPLAWWSGDALAAVVNWEGVSLPDFRFAMFNILLLGWLVFTPNSISERVSIKLGGIFRPLMRKLPKYFSLNGGNILKYGALLVYLLLVSGTSYGIEDDAARKLTIYAITACLILLSLHVVQKNKVDLARAWQAITVLSLLFSLWVVYRVDFFAPISFPLYYREIGYTVWTTEEYFGEIARKFSEGQCMAFFGGGSPRSRIQHILSAENSALYLNKADIVWMENIPLQTIDLSNRQASVWTPDCNCEEIDFYDDDFILFEPNSEQIEIIRAELSSSCSVYGAPNE